MTIFITLSIDPFIKSKFKTCYIVCINEQLCNCTCVDVSDLMYMDVKVFLLKFGSGLQNLVKKFQSAIKI